MASASVVLTSDTSGSVTVTVPSGTAIGTTTLTLPTSGGTIQTSGAGFTTNGVAYAFSTSALTTGSALTFDGTTFTVSQANSTYGIVAKSTSATTSARTYYTIKDSASSDLAYYGFVTSSDLCVWNGQNTNTRFLNNGTEYMRLDSSGNLLVGTASGSSSRIYSYTPNNQYALYTENTNASLNLGVFALIAARNTSNNSYRAIVYFNSGAGQDRFIVQDSGNVQNINNSYGAISDIKLKENIIDATPKLADLMQVKVRNYNLKSDPEHKQIGVVAQELEQIFPSMIDEESDKDKEGNDLGTTTKSVKYSVFVPMLIKAIQEQQSTIQSLTERITALENK